MKDEMVLPKSHWPSFYMSMAWNYAGMSSCQRLQVGCVFVKEKRILSGGFNEAPSGIAHCQGPSICNEKGLGCTRTIHAEENAIINAARHGVSTIDADAYCTHLPCKGCFGKLINAGIKRVFYSREYRKDDAHIMAEKVGIILTKVN